MKTTLRTIALLALATAVGAAGCGRHERPKSANADHPPVPVTVLPAGGDGGRNEIVLSARVVAREEVTVRATISGRITSLPLAEGRRFSKGSVLARFEAPETRAALAAARSAVGATSLRLKVARRQEERMDSLYAQRVAALRELEQAQEERLAAEAASEAAVASLEALRSGSEILAPFSGVMVRHHLDAGATASVGDPVLDIRSLTVGEIVAAVPEAWLSRIGSASAFVRVGDGVWEQARLARVDGMTDFQSRTRSARFVAGHGSAAVLEPGAYAEIRLESRAEVASTEPRVDRIRIAPGALVRRGSLTGVYVVRDGRAWLRWIRVGRSDEVGVEVLAGLLPGEAIASDPSGLSDGRAVTVAP